MASLPAINVVLRFVRLLVGLFVYGLGISLMVKANIGIPPWDVLAQGIAQQTKLSFGIAQVVVSVLVLLTWIPLRVKPGIGSILNAVLIGLSTDVWMPLLPTFTNFGIQLLIFVLGMCVVAFCTGLYISSNFGMGPRDGLVMGTRKKFGKPVWLIRTVYESFVLLVGWLLGGQVGLGTVMFAFGIGYLMQASLRLFGIEKRSSESPVAEAEG
jgi:uncharacterized membrane protein YczE